MSDDWRQLTHNFASGKERDQWIKENAQYFTVVRYLGPRKGYERHEVKTQDAAVELAGQLAQKAGIPYMVYAVAKLHDAMICYIDREGKRHDAK